MFVVPAPDAWWTYRWKHYPTPILVVLILLFFAARAAWSGYIRVRTVKTSTEYPDTVSGSEVFTLNEDPKSRAAFQLERRAFFSKTWIYATHRSRFQKAGDYVTFELAGITFFLVLGKDLKLRSFHNVCRHRAYTVIRRPCGTSTRFSCKYHGWQYDDKGGLVKAPKFDQIPGFNMQENGLFEIPLETSSDGLVFVNFETAASKEACQKFGLSSLPNSRPWHWLQQTARMVPRNWKEIVQQAHETGTWTFIGPLTLFRHVEADIWATMSLNPKSSRETELRYELYTYAGNVIPPKLLDRCISRLEIEAARRTSPTPQPAFSEAQVDNVNICNVDGKIRPLRDLLTAHSQLELVEKREICPAFRFTGTEDIDLEAEAISTSLEFLARQRKSSASPPCSALQEAVEW